MEESMVQLVMVLPRSMVGSMLLQFTMFQLFSMFQSPSMSSLTMVFRFTTRPVVTAVKL